MRKSTIRTFLVPLVLMAIVGCGTPVEVPPAHVGKLSTPSGLQEGIIPPSKLRLSNFCLTCDSLIIAEASDYGIKESMPVFMPIDRLNLTVEVRGTLSVSSEDSNVERIFSRVTAETVKHNDRVSLISLEQVYVIYGEPIIREAVRSIVTKYNIMQVMENRESISLELFKEIRKQLVSTPLTIIRFGLADVQPPKVILVAQEQRKEKEIAIEKAEAEKQVSLKEAEAKLEVAYKQQEVELKEAETTVLVNKKLTEGMNEAIVTRSSLKILETLAKSDNKVFFMPMEAMKNPAMILGSMIETR